MAAPPDLNWRPTLQRRLVVASAVFVLWVAGIETRLVVLQVLQHDELVARADQQQMRTVEAPAKRGEIFDRRGRMLAYSVDADTIWAAPGDIKDPGQTVTALCAVLDDCDKKFRTQLTERLNRQRSFVYVKRRVTPLEAKRVAALGLDGIRFMKESKRFYPNRELAANVLGYVGLDNVGLHGIEAAYDKVVRGRPGTLLVQTDARSHAFSRMERPPTIGSAIELTLDEQLQYIVERELKAGVAENGAEGGSAVIMDPNSGEILAMATWPTFNPNSYNESETDVRRNRAVQDLYEPGSTFKIVTASAAFEEHVVTPDQMIDASGGSIKFPGRKVINDTHDYGVLSFTDVIVKSSNVGAIKVGLKLGPERLGLYINRFGFGRPTSIDFPGENPGIVWNPAKLNDSALASVSMGYQVGVTPIQMAAAVSSVANGGTLYEPRILRTVVGDGTRTPVKPKVVRQTIKPETAATLTTIMEQVVERGTAKAAQLPGFTVAGKTGTAAKLINGRYSATNYNASFVGFVPSRAPALTIIVVIDSPHLKGHTGGAAAAPVFKRIADASLRYLGVAPTIGAAPPVMVARRDPGPVTATASPVDSTPVVTLAGSGEPPLVPDLRGQGAREAMRALARLGLTARISGAGVVIDQQPQPGSPLDPGATCTLVLSRQSQSPPYGRDATVTLADLIASVRELVVDESSLASLPADRAVAAVAYDSRRVGAGAVFVALRGLKADGVAFAEQAVSRGAQVVVAETPRPDNVRAPWIMVRDARLALALLADRFYGHPSGKMPVVGVTGTNGKTTTAYLLCAILDAAELKAGMLGTVAYRVGGEEREASRTTPEAPDVQQLLSEMLARGCRSAVMEVSSHALSLKRVDGMRFAAAVFSNLTRDHLDFHEDMEAYFAAKRRLFELLPRDAPGVINLDDPRGAALVEICGRPVTYAITAPADVKAGPVEMTLAGLRFEIATPKGAVQIRSRLVGKPNVYNILAATATAVALDVPLAAIARGIDGLAGVPGRFEVVSSPDDDVTVVVDYAHTDDALRNLLETARPLAAKRLITVFGCGGDRDRSKRPLMGMVAARLSDVVVITSDNPRSEDPRRIIEEIERGIPAGSQSSRALSVVSVVDRAEAIERVITLASPGDVVLVAGKGHEKYQQIGDRVLPFDDGATARAALGRRRQRQAKAG